MTELCVPVDLTKQAHRQMCALEDKRRNGPATGNKYMLEKKTGSEKQKSFVNAHQKRLSDIFYLISARIGHEISFLILRWNSEISNK